MKKALIVGIDNYQEVSDLNGCVNDAHAVANVLSRNADVTFFQFQIILFFFLFKRFIFFLCVSITIFFFCHNKHLSQSHPLP